jgi:hypothetical protein
VLNNLAANTDNTPQQSLDYSAKAVEAMQKAGVVHPYILDTHGWNLVQAGRVDEGVTVLRQAWEIQPFPELGLHLGEALIRSKSYTEAEQYLTKAQELFDRAMHQNRYTTDPAIGEKITDALSRARQQAKG